MDLIQGMESGEEREHEKALQELDQLLSERLSKKNRKIIALPLTWGIAASILLAAGILTFLLISKDPAPPIARNDQQPEQQMPPNPRVEVPQVAEKAADSPQRRSAPVVNDRPKVKTRPPESPVQIAALEKSAPEISPSSLDEVVVVGYGTVKKKEFTGAVSTVTDTPQLQSKLEGKLAGVQTRGMSSRQMTKSGVRVSGTVIDKEDGTPIPGVAVKVKGYPIGTSTDTEGRFVITVPEKGDAIEVISLGYEKEQIKISKADSLTIALKPNLAALSEVVVSSPQEAVETRPAEPVMGWNAYRKYLKSKATSPDGKKGSVTLSFTVSPAGEVGNAKVIKGLSEEVNKKALQLILEGPAWKGPSDGLTKEIRLRVKFR